MNLRYAKRSEDTEQINVASWAAWNERQYPELKWLHHIPNGGSRNKAEAVKLKQMGVKAGVSDFCLPYPKGIYCGLYIEMKFGDGKHQKSQKEFLTDNLLHIRGCGGGAARVLRVIVSTVDERTEQQCLERRHDLATEEKVRTGAWMNMQQ